jgi:signal transduction histidine kinase
MTACGPYAALIDRNNTSRTLLAAKVVAVGRLPGLRRLRGLGRWQKERVSIVAGCMTQLNQKTRAGVDLLSRNPNSHLRTAADDGNVLNLKVSPNRACDPFFTTKSNDRGTGLGLPNIRLFAESLGGHIEIKSKPSVGTSVAIFLPECDGL